MMNKMAYQRPRAELVQFENEDVITAHSSHCLHGNSNGECKGSNSKGDGDGGSQKSINPVQYTEIFSKYTINETFRDIDDTDGWG